MNVFKQLLRQPVRLIALTLLLCSSCTFFMVSFAVKLASESTVQSIEKRFTTIALPTNEKENVSVDMGNGQSITVERSIITAEMWEFIYGLQKNKEAVNGIYQQQFISAWSPDIETVTNVASDGQYRSASNAPYTGAVLVVQLTDIGSIETEEKTGVVTVTLQANIQQVLALHHSYDTRKNITLYCRFQDEVMLNAASLMLGDTYIVYGAEYVDRDLELRTRLSSIIHCSAQEINWDNVVSDGTGTEYRTADHSISLSTKDIQCIDSAFMVVQDIGAAYDESYFAPQIDGSTGNVPLCQLLSTPTIAPLSDSVENFLRSDAGTQWNRVLSEIQVQYQCVPVLGTDLLESMYPIVSNDIILIEGRMFSAEDYAGNRVCIIPEAVALESGLSVGDSLDMRFYWGADPYDGLIENANLPAQQYSAQIGFVEDETTYTVVGIYRQLNTWSHSAYSINPNTVFVPNATLPEICYTSDGGIFFSIVLKNGSIDEVRAEIVQRGYPEDLLLFYDEGYAGVENALDSFKNNADMQFIISCCVFLAVLLIYLVFFVRKQYHTIGLMLALGEMRRNVRATWWKISMVPVVVSIGAGVIIGRIIAKNAYARAYSAAFGAVDFNCGEISGEIGDPLLVACILQLMLMSLLFYLFILGCTKKSPMKLMRRC